MKKILFLLLLIIAWGSSSEAQMFYPDLSKNLKTSLSEIEKLYLGSLSESTYANEIDYGMMAIVGFDQNDKELFRLPVGDIETVETIPMKDMAGIYAIKFRHKGGWEYEGFYHIAGKENAETLKKHISDFVNGIGLYSYENVKHYCKIMNGTYTEDNMRILPVKHYEKNYKAFNAFHMLLLGLSGSNMDKDGWKEMGWKINWVLAKHAVDLQFIDDQPDFYCPSCPFIENDNLFGYLIRHFGNGEQYRALINRYRFNTNIVMVSPKGNPWSSSALDLVNKNIDIYKDIPRQVESYAKNKEYMMFLGAKGLLSNKLNGSVI